MKLAQFTTKNSSRPLLGLRRGGVVVDVTEVAPDLNAVINGGSPVIAALNGYSAGAAYALEAIDYLPAVRPSKIVAIGRNYYDHAVEGGSEPPASPLLFTKLPNSLSAHLAPIVLPAISAQVDYEAELAVIIGRRARQVREEEALDYIFGYTLINDVSARDLQFGDGQWVRGKGLDTFAPLGPFITTKDEIADVQKLKIEGLLNGQVMQSSNTSKMIFPVAYLIHYITQAITLEPGDVIATGTPEGVGIFRQPPVLLKPGDVFEVRIEGLGTLRNPVAGE
jgi:2-keto-4-pentenoate hydratase/2-oxohepta-3-ene-1,7-dioic acid hydratase in catechol pathway